MREHYWVEVKGFMVRDWSLRSKLFRALYGGFRLDVIDANDVRKLPR